MANNYSTLKLAKASKKLILARLEPGRYITDDLSLDAGTTYEMTFAFSSLSGIEVDGVAYTLVTGAPSSTEYSFDESTLELKINFGVAIGSKVVVALYYLHYCNDFNKLAYKDPEDSGTDLVLWNARIQSLPDFVIEQTDVITGFFSIGSTSLNLINADDDFQQYLTDNDSFFNKDCKIWTALDAVSNIKKMYDGKITSMNVGKTVSLTIDSALTKLLGTTYSNGTWLKSTFNTTNYSDVIRAKKDVPIPKFYQFHTPFDNTFDFTWSLSTSIGGSGSSIPMHDAPEAINISYNSTRATTANRTWGAYVANSGGGDFSAAITGTVTSHGLNQYSFALVGGAYTNLVAGDNIYVVSTGNFGAVVEIGASSIRIEVAGYTPLTNDLVYRPEISRVIIQDPAEQKNGTTITLDLVYTRDYTFSSDAQGVRKIVLANNFEANHGDYTGPLPGNAKMTYRAWNDDSLNHGTVLDTIVTATGLTVDSTSVTTANSTLIEMNFSIPFRGEISFPKTTDLVSRILKTTLGVLAIGTDNEIEYLLINAPTTGATTTTKTETTLGSFNQSIDYKDIYSEIRYYNKHGSIHFKDGRTFLTTSLVDTINTDNDTSTKVKYLHGVEKVNDFEHVAAATTNTFTRLKNLLYERRALYTFVTKGQHFESVLGDDVTISRSDILGGSATKDVTILVLNKRPNETQITASDLLGSS
jgi:hypothetical protein